MISEYEKDRNHTAVTVIVCMYVLIGNRKFATVPVPRATRRHKATNVSEEPVLATSVNKNLTMPPPTTRMPPRPRMALTNVAPNRASCADRGMGPELLSIIGNRTNRGTTAMSCSSRIPKQAAPNFVANCPFSCRIFSTKADDDSDRAAPITSASSTRSISTRAAAEPMKISRNCTPPIKGKMKKAAVQRMTCRVPMPNAYLDKPFSRSTVSSSPCSNSKNSTPKSAIESMSFRSENRFKPAGPIIKPAVKNPMTELALSHLNNGTMPMVVQKNINRSFPNGLRAPSVSRPINSMSLAEDVILVNGSAKVVNAGVEVAWFNAPCIN